MTQITEIIVQLFENGSSLMKNKKTSKEICSDLLESVRTRLLTSENIAKDEKLGKCECYPIRVIFI